MPHTIDKEPKPRVGTTTPGSLELAAADPKELAAGGAYKALQQAIEDARSMTCASSTAAGPPYAIVPVEPPAAARIVRSDHGTQRRRP